MHLLDLFGRLQLGPAKARNMVHVTKPYTTDWSEYLGARQDVQDLGKLQKLHSQLVEWAERHEAQLREINTFGQQLGVALPPDVDPNDLNKPDPNDPAASMGANWVDGMTSADQARATRLATADQAHAGRPAIAPSLLLPAASGSPHSMPSHRGELMELPPSQPITFQTPVQGFAGQPPVAGSRSNAGKHLPATRGGPAAAPWSGRVHAAVPSAPPPTQNALLRTMHPPVRSVAAGTWVAPRHSKTR